MNRKFLKVGGVAIGGLALACLGLTLLSLDDGVCRDTTTAETISPDGKYKATVWQLTCAYIDPPHTRVYLSEASYQFTWRGWWKPYPKQNPIFSAERMGDEINVKWSDSRTLLIGCTYCRAQDISHHHTQWRHVHIQYELPKNSQEQPQSTGQALE